ncbi:MAG: hypothetical protein IPJ00_02155 [Saprospirales bacterium]|nr:hypothetical protein [Saprospirales bacterium]
MPSPQEATAAIWTCSTAVRSAWVSRMRKTMLFGYSTPGTKRLCATIFGRTTAPENDDHADGIVRRYMEIQVKKDGIVPSHLVLDKASGWLYVVDNGNDRVLRLDINSGNVVGDCRLSKNPWRSTPKWAMLCWEVIVQEDLDRPCGIELIENRLLVGDYATGEIIVYDIDNNFLELGRIATGAPGLTGIKIGPDGSIWFTNRLQNTLTRLDAGLNTDVSEAKALAAQIVISPNPTNGIFGKHPGIAFLFETTSS